MKRGLAHISPVLYPQGSHSWTTTHAYDGLGFRSHFSSSISTTTRSHPGRPVHRSLQLAKDVFLALPVKMIQNTYYLDVLSACRLQIKYAQFGSATCRNDPLKRAKVYHGGLVDAYRNLPSLHIIGTKLLIILLSKYPKTIFFLLVRLVTILQQLGHKVWLPNSPSLNKCLSTFYQTEYSVKAGQVFHTSIAVSVFSQFCGNKIRYEIHSLLIPFYWWHWVGHTSWPQQKLGLLSLVLMKEAVCSYQKKIANKLLCDS